MASVTFSGDSVEAEDKYRDSKVFRQASARNRERDLNRQQSNGNVLPSQRFAPDTNTKPVAEKSISQTIYETGMKNYREQKQAEALEFELSRNRNIQLCVDDSKRRDELRSQGTYTVSGGLTQIVTDSY